MQSCFFFSEDSLGKVESKFYYHIRQMPCIKPAWEILHINAFKRTTLTVLSGVFASCKDFDLDSRMHFVDFWYYFLPICVLFSKFLWFYCPKYLTLYRQNNKKPKCIYIRAFSASTITMSWLRYFNTYYNLASSLTAWCPGEKKIFDRLHWL